MAEFVLLVLLIALVVYAVFGGADFGAGIIEPFIRTRDDIDVALAPVWEANHVWLVLALVVAFVGFPEFHALAVTYLHLPLLGVLLGNGKCRYVTAYCWASSHAAPRSPSATTTRTPARSPLGTTWHSGSAAC